MAIYVGPSRPLSRGSFSAPINSFAFPTCIGSVLSSCSPQTSGSRRKTPKGSCKYLVCGVSNLTVFNTGLVTGPC